MTQPDFGCHDSNLKQPELIAGIVHAGSVSRGAYLAFGKYRYFPIPQLSSLRTRP